MTRNELHQLNAKDFDALSKSKQATTLDEIQQEATRIIEVLTGRWDVADPGGQNFFISRHPDRIAPQGELDGIDFLKRWYPGEDLSFCYRKLNTAPLRMVHPSELRGNQPRPGYQGQKKRPALDLSQPRTWRNI